MKKRHFLQIAALTCLILFPSINYSQVFWTETFTNGCSANCLATGYAGINGAWSVTNTGINDPDFNPFYVSCAENGQAAGVCGAGCGSDASLHIGSAASVFGDIGAAYLNGGIGFWFVDTDIRAESPVINCTGQSNITISFNYIENGDASLDNATLWYFDGSTWSLLFDMAKTTLCGGQGLWTAYSMTLPSSANNNANVKVGFRWINNDDGIGSDPSFAVDDVTLSTPSTTNTIATGTITGSPFCAGDNVNVPFTSTGTFNAGNIYTAELSDASGSFASPVAIGTLTSTANSGTIASTIPPGTATGTTYRIRVIGSNPATTGTDNGIDIIINAQVTASVTITATPTTAICQGDNITFTATPVNGGSTPSYQWQVNGGNVGTNNATFSSTTINNGDVVTCILTSNATCVTGSPATSNAITVVVNPVAAASLTITASPSASICIGDNITFTATPTNGGSTPAYQWQVNGVNAGTNSNTFSSSTLANGDVITCIMTSNATCVTGSPATSNAITVQVSSAAPASVTISASPSSPICQGENIAFTATPVNGGTPTYQWQVNGGNVGTNSTTYSSTSLNNGDVVTCIMTSSLTCATGSPATSNAITIQVNPVVTASVTITASPSTTICLGDPVTFNATATNGGTPTYQWQINGVNAGTNSAVFTSSTIANGDVVTCIMTSNATCINGSPATSNPITIIVNLCTVPVASFTASLTSLCENSCTTFSDNSSNSPTSWNWFFPGGTPSSSTNQNPVVCYSVPGVYDVTLIVTNSEGSDSITTANYISVYETSTVNAGTDTVIELGNSVSLLASGSPGTYTWAPPLGLSCTNCQDPVASPVLTTTYIVTVDNNGCTASDTITVFVIELVSELFLPSAFSPNNDGENDVLYVRGSNISSMSLSIFDRWGSKVFETINQAEGWNGTIKGKPANSGTYAFNLYVLLINGEEIRDSGKLLLVR